MKEKNSNISSINNHYTQEQLKQLQKQQKLLIFRRRRIAVIFGIALVVMVVFGINIYHNYQELSNLKNEAQTVIKEQKQVHQEEQDLTDEVRLLKDDNYILKLARSKYYFSKEGEQIYNYPQDEIPGANVKSESDKKAQQ